jgi:F-box domain
MLHGQKYIVANILARCGLRDQFRVKRVCRKWNTYIDISTWPEQYTWLTGRPFPWIMYMLYKYPDKEWGFIAIYRNPLICLDDILAFYSNRCKYWTYDLASNPAVTWTDIRTHGFDSAGYALNPNITADMIVSNKSVVMFDAYKVVRNPSITWDDVMRLYPNKPAIWSEFSSNPNLTIHVITSYPDVDWDWSEISSNENITWDFVFANLDKNWNWSCLSQNPIITWDIVQQHPNLSWSYIRLSLNPNITWEMIQTNEKLQKDKYFMSCNPNITIDIVFAYPDWPWDWNGLSVNPSITWAVVAANMDKPWWFDGLSHKTK